MEDIKTFLRNPYTWLSLSVAAVLGVWWAKITPTTANLSLVVAILGFMVFLYQRIGAQPMRVRLLWTAALGCILSLGAYFTLWTRFLPLDITATTTTAEYPVGTVLGGVPWMPHYTEVRLLIWNHSPVDYRDIDLIVRPDQAVAKAGQMTDIANVSLSFDNPPVMSSEYQEPTGPRTARPVTPLASSNGYRLRCDLLPRHSYVDVVMAAVTVNKDADDMLGWFGFRNGRTFWFARSGHSEEVFGKKPTVSTVNVTGQYLASNKRNDISIDLPLQDFSQ